MTNAFDAVVDQCIKLFEEFDGSVAATDGIEDAKRQRMRAVLWHFYSVYDDAELDCTPFAHPAWYRGQVAGVEGAVERVREALAGRLRGKLGNTNLQELCDDVAKLNQER